MRLLASIGAVLFVYMIAPIVQAEPIYYHDRSSFLSSVGTTITDDAVDEKCV